MTKTKNNYFNYLAMYKDKETGQITRKKMYRNIQELLDEYKNEYSESNIKNRCQRTRNGTIKNGLLVFAVRVPLDDPSLLIKYKYHQ